ncbi:MAG TPA: PLP-dependent aminotransferase family protein [Thermoanaerobaculia bacterium]|jgi:DNA-binding transcriptional MocR family regulator|nr:PLP-dependent aminotransferase family protein [Thermoanaerobaculia bacterium]
MTIWSPRLSETPDPIYSRIADALERDIRAGVLVPSSRLPTHRELAKNLRITPVTVTRAYAEAMRRGLVESTTGRGTFVRATNQRRESVIATDTDLATNIVSVPLPSPSRALLERMGETLTSSTYASGHGNERHRAAGAAWIASTTGRETDPARVAVTAGTQHALFLAFAAATKPGDVVLTEALTYHGAKSVAALLGVKLEPVAIDRYGIVPDALERACRGRSAKVLYTVPSLHNPTGIVMPETRRREIAAMATAHGLTIIEDDVCGFLLEKTPPPLAAFAPDRTIFLTGLGKAIAPAMRIGYLMAPEPLLARVQTALAATVLFASPVMAEMAATWIEDGTASRIVAQKRVEVQLRNRLSRRILSRVSGDARSPHLWVELPKRWTPDAFVEEARRRRVRVAGAPSFAIGDNAPRAIRVSIGAPTTIAELEQALLVLAGIGEQRREEPVV